MNNTSSTSSTGAVTLAALIRDTAAMHGVAWAAKHYARKGVNPDAVFFALFGRYMRPARSAAAATA